MKTETTSLITWLLWFIIALRLTNFALVDSSYVTVSEQKRYSIQRCLQQWHNVFVSYKSREITCDVILP